MFFVKISLSLAESGTKFFLSDLKKPELKSLILPRGVDKKILSEAKNQNSPEVQGSGTVGDSTEFPFHIFINKNYTYVHTYDRLWVLENHLSLSKSTKWIAVKLYRTLRSVY